MYSFLKKRYLIPAVSFGLLFIGTGFKNDFFEIAKQVEIFTTLFKTINMNYVDETNSAELMDKAIKNMLSELDPYTVYFNEQDVVQFKINNTGEYTGIGALISRKNGRLIIMEPYQNYPADKAGLKAGDEIIQIGDIRLADFKEDASQLLKGAKNTKIDIQYKRQGRLSSTALILDEVELKAVPFFAKTDDETGYIVLTQFNTKASAETKQAIDQLKQQGAKKIILDLRGNPGGLLSEAVNICNLFVPKDEIIVSTKSHIEKYNRIYKTTKAPVDTEIPLAILIDGRSASASEIVAGALQDLDRAVIIGSRSFGKGLVQRPIDLTYGTQLKVTISRYYTPSGRCIQALDYGHKDKNGNAIRTEEKNYTAFKTRKGRTVFDGGGIQPDLELPESQFSTVTEALLKNDGIFNYVTDYYYKHPAAPGNGIPVITENDYNDFKRYLKQENFSFDTETEAALKNTLEAAKKEKIAASIAAAYEQLLAALQKGEQNELDWNKEEIKKQITDEIIKRYRYKEGLYAYYTQQNSEIKKAAAVLNNLTQYNTILKK